MTGPPGAPPPALYGLLGVDPQTPTDELRRVYDRAMTHAVRMGHTQRAVALSQAFDALPGRTRQQVYPAVAHRRASIDEGAGRGGRPGAWRTGGGRGGGGRGGGGRGGGVGGRRSGGRTTPARRRTIAVIVLVVLAVPLAAVLATHWKQWTTTPRRPQYQQVQQPVQDQPTPHTVISLVPDSPSETSAPATSAPGTTRRIPLSAPADSRGLVTVLCQPDSAQAGTVIRARPGAVVTCANGATPRVVG